MARSATKTMTNYAWRYQMTDFQHVMRQHEIITFNHYAECQTISKCDLLCSDRGKNLIATFDSLSNCVRLQTHR